MRLFSDKDKFKLCVQIKYMPMKSIQRLKNITFRLRNIFHNVIISSKQTACSRVLLVTLVVSLLTKNYLILGHTNRVFGRMEKNESATDVSYSRKDTNKSFATFALSCLPVRDLLLAVDPFVSAKARSEHSRDFCIVL
jgi:hypothetical protein